MNWPGWDSLDSVKLIGSQVRSATLIFWALLVIFEVLASVWKKFSSRFTILALIAFGIAVTGEYVQSKYDSRKEELHDAREADIRKEYEQKLQSQDQQLQQERDKTQANSLFTRAQNGDANAFDQVVQMESDPKQSSESRSTARRVVDSITETYRKSNPDVFGALKPNTPLTEDEKILKHGNSDNDLMP
jgi:glucan phosphoethanolaminetransferase (alkaline phosphatase superfamily)